MEIVTDDRPHGEARKPAAHRLLEANRERLVRAARRALLRQLHDRGAATADDIRAAVPLPGGVSPKAFGAVPGPLALAHIIKPDGFVRTARPVGHARPVTRWLSNDPAAAVGWLAAYPELPDRGEGVSGG
ncbi:MAG TPA: hypothetical protein VH092_06485 [Urbifossiella sp.]|jgi:hypothetical protein|nr:hypothetical protein [Urbifossiella sp.]